ncbi:beta-galactosidase [Paraglaciecola aquimarina]|uniref:Beta-galactosidase n=1 Tax=Paraglaciecola aquimarina TaxID=1235557 RepID=A0ABU3SV57_9ALTE|nr:beta-galactosidase [Paraglaciecola aquimarina]MDU0353909.1 beta-galactosidase [Paraglaciecola aquimarina]
MVPNPQDIFSLTAENDRALVRGNKVFRAFDWNADRYNWNAAVRYEEAEIRLEDEMSNLATDTQQNSSDVVEFTMSATVTESRDIHFDLYSSDTNELVASFVETIDSSGAKSFSFELPQIYSGDYIWSVYMTAQADNAPLTDVTKIAVQIAGVTKGDFDFDNDVDLNDITLFEEMLASGQLIDAKYDFNLDGEFSSEDVTALRELCTYDSCEIILTYQERVEQKVAQLRTLIEKVESKGIDVTRDKMALHTAETFVIWANWDEKNKVDIAKFYEKHPQTKDDTEAAADALVVREREGVEAILDQALAELTAVDLGELSRKPVVLTDTTKVTIQDGKFIQDGQPVFLGAYTWKPDEEETNQYWGNLNSHYISPNLFTNSDWDYSSWTFNNYIDADSDHRIGQTFIDQNFPKWIADLYPEIDDAPRIFHNHDIDHPFTKTVYRKLFETVLPDLKDKRSTELGYMLFNEPTYITQKDHWNNGVQKIRQNIDDANSATKSVTEETFKRFRNWLENRHGDIATLNELWGTHFTSFADVSITIPIDVALQGTPKWYDWCLFNMWRVTDWFTFMNNEIKAIDTDAKTHIKLMPWLWNEDGRHHGMDFETLLRMGDIIGFDAEAAYSDIWGREVEWDDEYSFDWQSAMMSFDFFSSVQPEQLLWDSENHFFHSSKFMELDINPDYVKSIYWMAFTHGLTGSSTWVWTREADGNFSSNIQRAMSNGNYDKEYIVDVTHQPKGLHALTRTMLEANAHANDLVLLQRQEKPIRVFYSETSAINQPDHMKYVRDAYKGLYFEGIGLGFATERILNEQDAWEMVVVSGAKYVTDTEFSALQNYLNEGGTVFIDADSLQFNEYGGARDTQLFVSNGTLVSFNSHEDLLAKVQSSAIAKEIVPSITLLEGAGATSHKTLAWRTTQRADGSHIVSVTNTGYAAVSFGFTPKVGTSIAGGTNLFTGNQVDFSTLSLEPMETTFLHVTQEIDSGGGSTVELGDWDEDGDVDIDDVRGLIGAIQAREQVDLAFDVNQDGIVNVLDARVIMSLCTRARCSTH